ncbi:histidine kinase [Streptomyces niveus]|uniref:histidine kinase n=1 Tax=Streptomyces niveus TaxID=193462 RepID=UPI0036B90964
MIAHSIGIIALQAGAAARVIETRPVAAREALSSIENAGRETLAGLRRMLGPSARRSPKARDTRRSWRTRCRSAWPPPRRI